MSQRQRLAWLLARNHVRMMPPTIRAHHRDVVGTLLADVVTLARMLLIAAFDIDIPARLWGSELERRAVMCARNRLAARID